MKYRPLCSLCHSRLCAVNYIKQEKTYFRKQCEVCLRKKKKVKAPIPSWAKAGYKKKPHCEKCGFKAKYKSQLFVYHIDGVLSNANWGNLKTVCANCQIEIAHDGLGWRQGDLIPDF